MSRTFILFSNANPQELVDVISPYFNDEIEVNEEDGFYKIRAFWKDGALLISHTEESKDNIYDMRLEEYQESLSYLEGLEFKRFNEMKVKFYDLQILCALQPVNGFLLSLNDYGLMIDQPILITDTELKAMLRADIAFDWYRWHQERLADPAVKARYYS